MKKTRFNETQIMSVLPQMEGGVPAAGAVTTVKRLYLAKSPCAVKPSEQPSTASSSGNNPNRLQHDLQVSR